MSSEWETVTLGDVLTLQRGMDLPVQDRKGGSVPIVASTGVVGYHDQAPVKGPGVVIGRSGSIGGGQYVDGDFWPLNTTLWVKDFHGNDRRFCYYLLRSMDFSGMNAGSGVPTLNRNHLHPMPTLRPPLAEQKAISQFLGALDDRITLLRETNATLEAIAQAIFKSWFVDFDPVRAKQEGRAPEGIDEATAALFPDSFEESALGLVPRGWRVGALSDLAAYLNGYAFKTKDWQDSGHPVVKIGNVKPGLIDVSGASCVSPRVVDGLERFKLSRGDLLVGMTGYVGETGLVPSVEPAAYLNQRVGKISTKRGVTDLGFVYCLVRNPSYKTHAELKSHGSAQANVSGTDLMAYPCVLPEAKILDAFNEILCPMIERILESHDKAQTLATLRDTLLPRLISGQLRLPDAQYAIAESAA